MNTLKATPTNQLAEEDFAIPIAWWKSLAMGPLSLYLKPDMSADRIALAPTNPATVALFHTLLSLGCQVTLHDRTTAKPYQVPVHPYADLTSLKPDLIYIVSERFGTEIEAELAALCPDAFIQQGFTASTNFAWPRFRKHLDDLRNAAAEETLADHFDNRPLAVVFRWPLVTEPFHLKAIEAAGLERLGWDFETIGPPRAQAPGFLHATFNDIVNYCRFRRVGPAPVFFTYAPVVFNLVPWLLRQLVPQSTIVHNPGDWLPAFCPVQHQANIAIQISNPEATLAEYAVWEGFAQGRILDGIVTNNQGLAPILEAFPGRHFYYPNCLDQTVHGSAAPEAARTHRLLFLAQLYRRSEWAPGFDFVDFQPLFTLAKRHQLPLDAYFSNIKNDEDPLLVETQTALEPSTVNLFKGIPQEELITALCGKYDWGFLLLSGTAQVSNEHFKITMPSKVFVYLALGLPLIASAEMNFVSEMIMKHEIGICVANDDWDTLPDLIASADYQRLQKNVIEFRKTIVPSAFFQDYVNFLKNITNV